MESEYEKRARQKAEYLLALRQQKTAQEASRPAAPEQQMSKLPNKSGVMTERERRLEERKRAFMAKKKVLKASPAKGVVPPHQRWSPQSSPRGAVFGRDTEDVNPFAGNREPPRAPPPQSPPMHMHRQQDRHMSPITSPQRPQNRHEHYQQQQQQLNSPPHFRPPQAEANRNDQNQHLSPDGFIKADAAQDRRSRQQQYAEELQRDQSARQARVNEERQRAAQYDVNEGLVGLGAADRTAAMREKADRQRQYAVELEAQVRMQEQQQQQQQQEHKHMRQQGGGILEMGSGDDGDKRQRQAEYARQLDMQAHQQARDGAHRPSSGDYGPGGGGLGIGNAGAREDNRRAQQLEYARQLDIQAKQQQAQRRPDGDSHYGPGGGGLGIGGGDGISDKRAQQAEYARQLQLDQMQQHAMPSSDNGSADGVGLQVGGGALHTRDALHDKRLQQEAFARQLANDAAVARDNRDVEMPDRGGGGGLAIGQADNASWDKRQRQQQYAHQLAMQQHEKDMRPGSEGLPGGGGLAIGDRGGGDKRAQQAQYAAELAEQQYQKHSRPKSRPLPGGGNLNIGGRAEGMDEKRLRQAEYAAELQRGQQLQQQERDRWEKGGNQGLDIGGIVGGRDEKHSRQAAYAAQLAADEQNNAQLVKERTAFGLDMFGKLGQDEQYAKDAKRAKQMQYQAELDAHKRLHDQYALQRKRQQQQPGSPQGAKMPSGSMSPRGGLAPGWVMGPLGVPVRRTFDVGNRGIQRANRDRGGPPSPRRDIYPADGKVISGGGGVAPGGVDQGQQNMAGGCGDATVPTKSQYDYSSQDDERAAEARARQIEQARILEEQIALKKREKLDAKKKEEEEEREEWERLERERQEMAAAFAKEQEDSVKKREEDRKRELDNQIEERRRLKEAAERKEREDEERENAKLARERAELVRKEAEEMRREKLLEERGIVAPLSPRQSSPPIRGGDDGVSSGVARTDVPTAGMGMADVRRKSLFDPPSPVVGDEPGPDATSSPIDGGRLEMKVPTSSEPEPVQFQPQALAPAGPRRASIQRSDGLMGPQRYQRPAPNPPSQDTRPDVSRDDDIISTTKPYVEPANVTNVHANAALPQGGTRDDSVVQDLREDLSRAREEQILAKQELESLRKLVADKRDASVKRAAEARERERRQEARQAELEEQLRLLAAHVDSPSRPVPIPLSSPRDTSAGDESNSEEKGKDNEKDTGSGRKSSRQQRRQSRLEQLEEAARRAELRDVLEIAPSARADLGLGVDDLPVPQSSTDEEVVAEEPNLAVKMKMLEAPPGTDLGAHSRFVFPDGRSFTLGDDVVDANGKSGRPGGKSAGAAAAGGAGAAAGGAAVGETKAEKPLSSPHVRAAGTPDGVPDAKPNPTPAEPFRSLKELAQRRQARQDREREEAAVASATGEVKEGPKQASHLVPALVLSGPPTGLSAGERDQTTTTSTAGTGVSATPMTAREKIMMARKVRGKSAGRGQGSLSQRSARSRAGRDQSARSGVDDIRTSAVEEGEEEGGDGSGGGGDLDKAPELSSSFDIERVMRRNRRKWDLLQQLDSNAVPVGLDPRVLKEKKEMQEDMHGEGAGRHAEGIRNDVALSVLMGLANVPSNPSTRPSTVEASGLGFADENEQGSNTLDLITASANALFHPRAATPLDDLASGVVPMPPGMANPNPNPNSNPDPNPNPNPNRKAWLV